MDDLRRRFASLDPVRRRTCGTRSSCAPTALGSTQRLTPVPVPVRGRAGSAGDHGGAAGGPRAARRLARRCDRRGIAGSYGCRPSSIGTASAAVSFDCAAARASAAIRTNQWRSGLPGLAPSGLDRRLGHGGAARTRARQPAHGRDVLADHVQRLQRAARDGGRATRAGFQSAAAGLVARRPRVGIVVVDARARAGTRSMSGLILAWPGQSSRSAPVRPARAIVVARWVAPRDRREQRQLFSVRPMPHRHGSSRETAARRARYGPTATPASVARVYWSPSGDQIAFRTWTNKDNGESMGIAAGKVDDQLVPLLSSTSGGDALLGWASDESLWVVPFGVMVLRAAICSRCRSIHDWIALTTASCLPARG